MDPQARNVIGDAALFAGTTRGMAWANHPRGANSFSSGDMRNSRGLRLEPASDGTNQSPNVIGGIADNSVGAGVSSWSYRSQEESIRHIGPMAHRHRPHDQKRRLARLEAGLAALERAR